ncbi:MAG: hypothetical protein LJE94_11450 [Deltaproteobacteria bacterium]|jgi:hypothetical protein|nr:hypothetical protein [Deltaproteobacteria bacterium]
MMVRLQTIYGNTWLAFSVSIFLLLCACGVKAPPVPQAYRPPEAVEDLAYAISKDGIVALSWSLPETGSKQAGKAERVKIFRARESLENPACENCPLRFRMIKKLSLEKDKLIFRETLEKGYRYHYKLVILDDDNRESGDSNVVSFEYR